MTRVSRNTPPSDRPLQIGDLTRAIRTRIHECGCGCWVWTGSADSNGYAKMKLRGVTTQVHRFTWQVVHGEITDDLTVDHLCDRHRRCVNPAHMELITRSENSTRANVRRWAEGERDRSLCTDPPERKR